MRGVVDQEREMGADDNRLGLELPPKLQFIQNGGPPYSHIECGGIRDQRDTEVCSFADDLILNTPGKPMPDDRTMAAVD